MKMKSIYVILAFVVIVAATIGVVLYINSSRIFPNNGGNWGISWSVRGVDSQGNVVDIPSGYSIVNSISNIQALLFSLKVTDTGTCPVYVTVLDAGPSDLKNAFPNIGASFQLLTNGSSREWDSNSVATTPLSGVSPHNVNFNVTINVTYVSPIGVQCNLADGSKIYNGQSQSYIMNSSVTYEIDYDLATGSSTITFGGGTTNSTNTTIPTNTTNVTCTNLTATRTFTLTGGTTSNAFCTYTCPTDVNTLYCIIDGSWHAYANGTMMDDTFQDGQTPLQAVYYSVHWSNCLGTGYTWSIYRMGC